MKDDKDKKFPEKLKAYKESDFGLKARVRFFYHVIIVMAIGMLLVLMYTGTIQLVGPDFGYLFLPVLIPEILIILFILLCLYLLVRGNFRFSTHLLIITSLVAIWTVMFLDESNLLTRFDTIVYVFAIMSMTPLTLKHGKLAVLIYVGTNLLVLIVFLAVAGSQLKLPVSLLVEFFLEVCISLTFIGIVGYNIFIINKRTHEKAIIDINERHEAEKALLSSERKYRTLFENAQIGIYQTTPSGEILNVNPAILAMTGYGSLEELKNINLERDDFHSKRSEFKAMIEKDGYVKNFETQWRIKRGKVLDIIENSSAVRDSNGKILYYDGFVENITERKRAERELLESQQQYLTLAEISPVGIFRTDAQGNTTYVNPKWTELSGLGFDDALGEGWLKAVHPDDRELLINTWNKDYSSSRKSVAEYRFLRPDGKVIWVLGNAVPEIINGEIKGYVGTITNISEIKNALSALEKSEKRFRDLADLLPQPVWESTLNGSLTFVNKHGLRLFGLTENDMNETLDIFSFIIPEERKRANKYIQDVLIQSGKGLEGDEFTGLRKDGSLFPIKAFLSIIFEDQVPVGIRSIVVDMSEIKKAEYELKESEARYRSIIEAFPDIIMITDLDGNVLFGNEPYKKIACISKEEYNNPGRHQNIHPDDIGKVTSTINNLLISDEKHTGIIEYRFIDKYSNVYWFSGIISKIVLKGQTMLQTIARDVTEKKANEIELDQYRNRLESLVKERTDELEAANEELVAVNEKLVVQHEKLESTLENLRQAQKQLIHSEKMASLGVLAAGVAHEINNPLNFIQGGITGLENYFEDNMESHLMDIKPLIEGMNEGVRRAASIVASLSHYSRQSEIPMTRCDIHPIIDNCLVILQNQTKNRITINRDYFNQPLEINCNEGKMHQAILNILANAVQSIEKEGAITIRTSFTEGKMELLISDTGYGIKEDNISHIFDPFFTTKEPGKGTGLGLSITYNIIHEHNGEIHCRSKVNQGTEFVIYLPVHII